ncbi:hypothetical protein B9T13_04640 [Wohlfahrtiimonas chitiniclastica]|uniref:hypothetical protein n=1 Tax=Wohlfahrtiimonas chitiniclastica TaxID=400946 RepID=UPI000B991A33|nr:hypothetical protein [Wohlfahrtiimonas chitiniclastica]OYQ70551.1 hypothetical protein B9T13_04640 [Wohlfahrtiimonas chitiniclastica]
MQERKKTTRREATSIRFDPKLKYLLEIAARVQRRNLTNYIEWAVEESLKQVRVSDHNSIADISENLWDIDESHRFLYLAAFYPELLTYEEQEVFKVIKNNFSYLKKEESEVKGFRNELLYDYYHDVFQYQLICLKTVERHWEDIKALKPFKEWKDTTNRNRVQKLPVFQNDPDDDIPF